MIHIQQDSSQPAVWRVIGLMSGTSADGLDMAHCVFSHDASGRWQFDITHAETLVYNAERREQLLNATALAGVEYARLHTELGRFFGTCAADFIKRHGLVPDAIASHGHTIFHQPDRTGTGFTSQIGCGASLAVAAGVPVVCDFRTADVAAGGQGAPLVPIGDALLFADYDAALNLGGIANVSFRREGISQAFDICPVNMLLNHWANRCGRSYDAGGELARAADSNVHTQLGARLDALPFYTAAPPKSLGREWFEREVLPLIYDYVQQTNISPEEILAISTRHAARQIAHALCASLPVGAGVLITGGGVYNTFLLDCLAVEAADLRLIVPDDKIVQFKEALVFAFLGVLRLRGEANCLGSVTGASRDTCGGAVYAP